MAIRRSALHTGDTTSLLEGSAENVLVEEETVTTFAIQPPNFVGMSPIPKLMVEVGDEVKAGDPILFDKKVPEVKHCAPVSGEVIAVNRGEKRAITEVVILADKEMKYRELRAG
jgi:Na+-transporting NADH:ubiquinone oxidoreductase subunit A